MVMMMMMMIIIILIIIIIGSKALGGPWSPLAPQILRLKMGETRKN